MPQRAVGVAVSDAVAECVDLPGLGQAQRIDVLHQMAGGVPGPLLAAAGVVALQQAAECVVAALREVAFGVDGGHHTAGGVVQLAGAAVML